MRIDTNGYVRCEKGSYQHRNIVERVLGRLLKTKEIVHHIDGNRKNNQTNNLLVCPNQGYHLLIHARQRILDLGGNPDTDKYCSYHNRLELKTEFSTSPYKYDGLHNTCKKATNKYRKDKDLNTNKFNWRARLNQQYRRLIN